MYLHYASLYETLIYANLCNIRISEYEELDISFDRMIFIIRLTLDFFLIDFLMYFSITYNTSL